MKRNPATHPAEKPPEEKRLRVRGNAATLGHSAARILGIGLSISLLATAPALAPTPASADSSLDYNEVYDQGLLGKGRQAYRERRDYKRAWDAYEHFKAYLAENPKDSVGAWHLSLACYYLGIRVLDDEEAKKNIFIEGRDIAEGALEFDSECAECHLLTATNHALWSQEEGIFRTLVGLPKVKRHLNDSIELDPSFGGAAAQRVSAYIASALPRFMGGGRKKARGWIERALVADPVEPMNYAFLAELLLDDYNNPKKALEVAEKGLELPAPAPEYVESHDAIRDLKKIAKLARTKLKR